MENTDTPFTVGRAQGQVVRIPISHGEGNYFADQRILQDLENRGQVVFRYSTPAGRVTQDANPNGSVGSIAGIVNPMGNVLGMMPHPERCCEELMGGTDGRLIFQSIITSHASR